MDLDAAKLRIERGIVLADGELVEQGTKTHQVRAVALDTLTTDALREHLAWQDEIASACGASVPADSFVFTGTADASVPWRPDAVTRDFRRLCAKVGVTGVRLHDLRHYVATRLLSSGIDVRTVAGRLGHRNASTTLDVYAHFVPGADRDAADALEVVLREAAERVDGA